MKRGTTPTLKIKLGMDDLSHVSTVEFILKQECDEDCDTFVLKEYPSASVTLDEDVFYVEYTDEETRKFKCNSTIWLDTRITMETGKIPCTEMVALYMNGTLFAVDEPEPEVDDDNSESA